MGGGRLKCLEGQGIQVSREGGSGGRSPPDVGEFLRKLLKILMKNSIKFEFYNGKFQYILFLSGPGAKPPVVGEFLRKLTKILMKNSIKYEFYNGKF